MVALGRLYAPDERDDKYPFRLAMAPPPGVLPTAKFWRAGRPILHQENMPHCVAFSWKHWLMASPLRQGHTLSERNVYNAAQLIDEWPGENYDGTSVRAGAKILQELNFISNYFWAKTAEEIKQWILTTGPVVVGTNWYEGMSSPHHSKRGESVGYWAKPEGALLGGHAYLVNGYSLVRRAFRCLNSWGLSWAEEGKFWIAEEHLAQLINESGEACTALERKSVVII